MSASASSELPEEGEEQVLNHQKVLKDAGRESTKDSLECLGDKEDKDQATDSEGNEKKCNLIGENTEEIEEKKKLVISLKPKAVLPEDEETQSSPPNELSDTPSTTTTTSQPEQDVTFIKNSIMPQTFTLENSVKTLPYIQDAIPNSSTSSDCDADSEAGTSSSSTTSIDYPALPHVPHLNATPQRSLLKRRSENTTIEDCSAPKKKRSIAFDGVTVFYFPRAQGFTCVPSQGGSTLGMGPHHSGIRKFSLGEHAAEQRRLHKQTLVRLRQQQQQNHLLQQQGEESLAGDEETNPTGSQNSHHSSDDSDSHEEESDSDLDMDLDNYYFLQPVPTRQRRILLREAGIKKIDSLEKEECRDIRTSREFCGCSCKSYCDPDSCSCAQAGIKCQVDRLSFPCGCSRDGCANHNGRIEFNPIRVRTHFIHTLMRIELEKKQCEPANGNMHLANSSLLSSNSAFQNSHEQQQQQAPANGLSVSGSMGDISLPYNQSAAALQHQLKPHCSFQQHWNTSNAPHQIHPQPAAVVDDSTNQQYKYSRSLLRDISFSSTMELESCVNAGNYTNVHFEPLLDVIANPNMNSNLSIASSQPLFHPGDELSGREDSLDLYSTFREDSYSETSDDFSNESGDNRFTPVVTSGPINNSHNRPLEMNFLVQNGVPGVGVVNQSAGLDSTILAHGRPSQRHNHYVDASYYSHNHASVQSPLLHQQQHSHQQPPYHQSMIAHSHSHRQSQPQQQQPYHHSHSHQNTQPMYNHANATNHTYPTDATQQEQQQQQQTLPHIHNHDHNPYNANVCQSMYSKQEYTNGYSSLEEISNGCEEGYSTNRQIDHQSNGNIGNGNSPTFLPLSAAGLPLQEEVLHENGTSRTPDPENESNKNVPAYTDLNTVTSYTKLEPFTEILQGAAKGACKNAFQTLQQISREEEDIENKVTEGEPESHSDDDGITENFGEIIKKSMVETVSA